MGANAAFLTRWYEEIWNRGRADAIDELLAPEAIMHGLGSDDLTGREAFRAFHAAFRANFSDIQITVEKTVEEGAMISAWCRATANHRESGTEVAFQGAVFGEIRDGRLQEGWNSWDFLALLAQLGAVDSEAVAPILGG